MAFLGGVSHSVCSQSIDSLKAEINSLTNDSLKAYALIKLAEAYLAEKNWDLEKVSEAADQAMKLAMNSKDTLAMLLSLECEGHVLYYKGLHEKCLSVYFQILRNAEKINQRDLMARSHRMMGWIDLEMKELESALDHFMKAIKIFKEIHVGSREMARAYRGIGQAYFDLNRLREAKKYFDSALNQKPGLPIRARASAMSNVGYIVREVDHDLVRSQAILENAKQLVENSKQNIDVYSKTLAELSITLQARGQFDRAKQFSKKAYLSYSSDPLKSRYIEFYTIISNALIKSKDFESAFQIEREMRTLNDSIFSVRNQSTMANLKVEYESEKKQAEINALAQKLELERVKAENRNRVIAIVSVAASLIMALLVGLYFLRAKYQAKVREIFTQKEIQKEKERIARDLHDNIGTQLTALSMGLHEAGKNSHIEYDKINALQEHASITLSELRDTIWAISKDNLTVEQLYDKVESMLWRLQKENDTIKFTIQVDGPLTVKTLSSDDAINLFRIVQEAVNNGIKHSQAKKICVHLISIEKRLSVKIEDDGIGFGADVINYQEKYGLNNMRKRAEQMMATLSITSAVNSGTSIEVALTL